MMTSPGWASRLIDPTSGRAASGEIRGPERPRSLARLRRLAHIRREYRGSSLTGPSDIGYARSVASTELVERRVLADEAAVGRMLRRLASHIVERRGGAGLALVGIRTGGLLLAERLAGLIEAIEGTRPPLGAVDITLYRDDVFRGLPRPEIGPTDLPFALEGVVVVLVDDVLFTGRTVRAAL